MTPPHREGKSTEGLTLVNDIEVHAVLGGFDVSRLEIRVRRESVGQNATLKARCDLTNNGIVDTQDSEPVERDGLHKSIEGLLKISA